MIEVQAKILGLISPDKKPTQTLNQEFILSFGDKQTISHPPISKIINSENIIKNDIEGEEFMDLGEEVNGLKSGFEDEDTPEEED